MSKTPFHCDTIKQSRFLTRILCYLALWPKRGETKKKRSLRLLLLHLPTTILYTTLMWVDVLTTDNIDSAVGVLYMALTETSLCVKIYTIWKYGPMLADILENCQHSKIQTLQERNMWHDAQRQFGFLSKTYITLSSCAIYSAFLSVFTKGYSELPIPFWVPYDFHVPHNFWITFGYEFIAMPTTGLANCSLDMLFCYFIYHVSLLYKQLGMRLQSLGQGDFALDDFVRQRIIKNIQLHQEIFKICMKCEEIVERPILIQITFSTLVICFSIYKLKSATDPSVFMTLFQYAMVMSFQIFLPCFYASKITSNSKDLLQNIYSSKWPDLSLHNRRLILMFMQYLNKPVILRAAKFFTIGVPVFSKVIHNAYNLLAVILNVNK